MGNNKVLVGIAISCVVLGGVIFFKTGFGNKYDTKGKIIILKCEKCAKVVEMEADKYEGSMRKITEGLSSAEIMRHPHLYLDCPECGGRLWVAIKDPQTNEVEIVGRPK